MGCETPSIIEKGKPLKRTHDILDLIHEISDPDIESRISIDDAIYLNSVYKGRYPAEEGLLPYGDPTKADAEQAVIAATKIRDTVVSSLN